MEKGAEAVEFDYRKIMDYARECEEKIRRITEELKNKISGELNIIFRPYPIWQERNSENGELFFEIPKGMSRINFRRVGMSFEVLREGKGEILELFEAALDLEPNAKNVFQIYEKIDLALREVSEC